MLDEFSTFMKGAFNLDMINYFDKRTLKDLQYLLLKCKDPVKSPDRVISFINAEINRRIYVRNMWISIIAILISMGALGVSLFSIFNHQ